MEKEGDFFEAGLLHEPLDKETVRLFRTELADHFEDVTVTGNEISVRGKGVTSTFTLDPTTSMFSLLPEKSYDLFADDATHTGESDSRPLETADEIHAGRKVMLEQVLEHATEPMLIDLEDKL